MGHQQVTPPCSLCCVQVHHKVPTQRGLSDRSSHLFRLLHTQLTAAYGSAFAAEQAAAAAVTAAAATHTIKIDHRS